MTVNKLKNVSLDEMHQSLVENKTVGVKIGKLGGRTFTMQIHDKDGKLSTINVKMKQLVAHLAKVAKSETGKTKNIESVKIARHKIVELEEKLLNIDIFGDKKLKDSSKFVQFLTKIIRYFANAGHAHHAEALLKIRNAYVGSVLLETSNRKLQKHLFNFLEDAHIKFAAEIVSKWMYKAMKSDKELKAPPILEKTLLQMTTHIDVRKINRLVNDPDQLRTLMMNLYLKDVKAGNLMLLMLGTLDEQKQIKLDEKHEQLIVELSAFSTMLRGNYNI